MNQQDVYLIHMRELYTRRIHQDPFWRHTLVSGIEEHEPVGESETEGSLFVVDWQMEEVACTDCNDSLLHEVNTDFTYRNLEIRQESSETGTKEKYSYIIDW